LFGLLALYYVAMNVFVGTRMFRAAVSYDPNALLVDYDRAYSPLPGIVHVDGLRIRGRDSHVEWLLALDHCDFRVSFTDLLRRRFHASQVEGDGLALRVRRRLDSVTTVAMAATPTIPGFLDPPVSDVGPPPAPLTDENYSLWSVYLDGARARHVREIWIDTVRYSGDVLIAGSWFFRPMRWLTVEPASIEMHPLDVSFGEVEPWVKGASGTLRVAVHPTDLVATPSSALVGRVSIHGDVGGEVVLSNPLNRLVEGAHWAPAAARFDARIDVDRGVVESPTHATLDPFEANVVADGWSLQATTRAEVEVDPRGLASATAATTDVQVHHGGALVVRSPKTTVRATTRALDLARLPTGSSLRALETLALDARAVDLPWLPAIAAIEQLPEGLSIEGGSGHADLTVDWEPARDSGSARGELAIEGLRARFVGQSIAGAARLALRVKAEGSSMNVSGTSLLFHTQEASPAQSWWGGVELVQATLRGLRAPHLEGRVLLHAKDASPLAALVVSNTPIPKFAVDAVSTTDLQATAEILASPSAVEARSVRAHCAGLDGRFEYVLRGRDAVWALWLDLGLLRAAASEQGGTGEWTLFDTEPWFAARVARMHALEQGIE
jgi:hypothetical protein